MAYVHRLEPILRARGRRQIAVAAHRRLDVLQQPGLVLLDGQDVVRPRVSDLLGDVLLAAHGVDAHQRPFQVQQLQQLGDGRDLVALVLDGDQAQRQAGRAGPGADQVQGLVAGRAVARAAQGLAVDRHLARHQVGHGGHPTPEAGLELHGVDQGEEAAEGVVGGDAVGQLQEAAQPLQLGVAEALDGHPVVRTAQDSTQGHRNHIQQLVPLAALDAWVS